MKTKCLLTLCACESAKVNKLLASSLANNHCAKQVCSRKCLFCVVVVVVDFQVSVCKGATFKNVKSKM